MNNLVAGTKPILRAGGRDKANSTEFVSREFVDDHYHLQYCYNHVHVRLMFLTVAYPFRLTSGIQLVHFVKELGLNSSFKFLRSRIKSTRVLGFVLMQLGARAMKFFLRNL